MRNRTHVVVIISANAEWRVISNYFIGSKIKHSPYGAWFSHYYKEIYETLGPIVFIHGGWGKVAAAASTQYAIDNWQPRIVINLGTCGGFDGEINKGEVIFVEKTVIYDIFEQMGDPDEPIRYYTTDIDTSWVAPPYPIPVRQSLLVSGDRDLFSNDIPALKARYGAIAGDWESGAIAWVTTKNNTQCLILRGVTDLVGADGGEAYNGNFSLYHEKTKQIMKMLLDSLPLWILKYMENNSGQDKKLK